MNTALKRSSLIALVFLTACASLPSGPSVMTLPGSRKSFDEFRADDADCRQFAHVQVGGTTPQNAAAESGVAAAAVGTAIGAGAGALIGGTGAAAGVGAGIGLVTGALVGTSYAGGSWYTVQQRYDNAYQQCMYAKGNRIQVPAAFARSIREQPVATAPPGPVAAFPPPPNAPPPPPPGAAPPPPPGAWPPPR